MGQYYRPIIEEKGKKVVYGTYLDGEYECAKLMEQSWYTNPFVNAVVSRLYNKPNKIAWVGDYAISVVDDFPNTPVQALYNTAYGENSMSMQSLKSNDFTLDDKFLVNHDTAEFIDLNKYYTENLVDGYCTHPVSLLTALGNGCGGGDFMYHAESEEQVKNVGKWAWNTLEITDIAPKGYKEVMYLFREK
jgi:hypothetical protein